MLLLSAAASAADSAKTDAFNYKVIASVSLTKPFDTTSRWRFVVTQEPDEHHPDVNLPGLIHLCFVRNDKPDCSTLVGRVIGLDSRGSEILDQFNTLERAEVVHLSGKPLLLVSASAYSGGPASSNLTKTLWTYRADMDTFERVFSHYSFRNNNEETRLMTRGPLAGDVVVSKAPTAAPYHYSITVYRLSDSGQFVEILNYTGRTRYGNGDRRAVIDSEMAEILRRLHLSKPGISP